LLRIQRPMPVKPNGIIADTALITEVFRNGANDPNKGRANHMPLGDLLAYAEGYDKLHWSLADFSNENGYGQSIVSGELDIRPFREALAALPLLKVQLDLKVAGYFSALDSPAAFSFHVVDFLNACERRFNHTLPDHR
jgi:hypothetical protein